MKLFSYVVARDYGFAPNPFFRICTLATCKPKIRKPASIGDWIIGTGSKPRGRRGYLVYAMCVTETMTFNEYWEDERFQRKKPNLRGSMKQAFGDNIYFKDDAGEWHQQDSHHSCEDGSPNLHNIRNDTQTDRVLLSKEYSYWGGSGPEIPLEAFLKLGFRSLMRLKASDTGGIWPYEKRLTPRYFIPPQSGPMGVLKRLLRGCLKTL